MVRAMGAGLILLCAMATTGCLAAQIPTSAPPPTATSSPVPVPSEGPGWVGGDLTYAAGSDLDPATYIEWADGMAMSDAYEVDSPDDGNGHWSHTHIATGCVASFWQGTLADYDLTGGDQSLSDQVLAHDFQEETAKISAAAGDVDIAITSGSVVQMRAVTGQNEQGTTYVVLARGFSTLSAALYFSLDCPTGQDAVDVFDEVRNDFSVYITPAAG